MRRRSSVVAQGRSAPPVKRVWGIRRWLLVKGSRSSTRGRPWPCERNSMRAISVTSAATCPVAGRPRRRARFWSGRARRQIMDDFDPPLPEEPLPRAARRDLAAPRRHRRAAIRAEYAGAAAERGISASRGCLRRPEARRTRGSPLSIRPTRAQGDGLSLGPRPTEPAVNLEGRRYQVSPAPARALRAIFLSCSMPVAEPDPKRR